jgi:predicted DNA binding protein
MNNAIVIQNKVIEEFTKEYAEYLEKEKEQIRNAYNNGYFAAYKYKDWEQYYKQNYNQNK